MMMEQRNLRAYVCYTIRADIIQTTPASCVFQERRAVNHDYKHHKTKNPLIAKQTPGICACLLFYGKRQSLLALSEVLTYCVILHF